MGWGKGLDPLHTHTHSPENHKSVGFLGNTGLDPLEKHKASKTAFSFWPLLPDSKTSLSGI